MTKKAVFYSFYILTRLASSVVPGMWDRTERPGRST